MWYWRHGAGPNPLTAISSVDHPPQRFRRRTEFDSDSEGEEGDEWGPVGEGQLSDSEEDEVRVCGYGYRDRGVSACGV